MNTDRRIEEILKALNINAKVFSEKLGYERPQIIYDILKGKTKRISEDLSIKIISVFPNINRVWLLTGEGDMLSGNNANDGSKPCAAPSKSEPMKTKEPGRGVPYYNIDFIGGFDIVLNDQTVLPEYYIDFRKYNSADCWCNVTGHSMEPEINHGDIVALKEVHDWTTYLPSGEIYGIVTTEHRTIKKVSPSGREGYLRLIPVNKSPEYVEQEIPASIVLKVYKVLGCVKRL